MRGTVRWSHLNFYGGARHATADAKYSAIDRGAKFSFIEPYFLRRGVSFNLSGTAWRTNQLTYDSNTVGGRATVAYHSDAGLTGIREATHREIRVGYVHEYLRYGITSGFEDQTLRSERIALGLDPDTGRGAGTLSALDLDLERVAVDDALNPHRGTIASAHVVGAFRFLRGAYHYQELMLEGRGFLPLGHAVVWANRARIGSLFAEFVDDMPFSARYFLGGSTSVRGWGRFELSPLNSQGQPVGGRSLVEASTELRFPLRGRLSGVAFVDAGTVGYQSGHVDWTTMHYAARPGVRFLTPIGAMRADLGVQLNRVPGLVVDGEPERRRWRLHFASDRRSDMARRRVTRWIIGIVGGALLLLATSAIVVETPWFKERLRRIVVTRANETLNGDLIVGHLTGSLITGVELHNVVFTQPGGPVFAAERIAVRYDPRILIRGKFVLDELTLTRPVIHIAQRAGGWNVANLVAADERRETAGVLFQKLTIGTATFESSHATSAARRLVNVNAALDLTCFGGGESFEVTCCARMT